MGIDARLNGLEPSRIDEGSTLGLPIRLGGYALIALVFDAAWTAQPVTFQTSLDYDIDHESEATWHNIYFDSVDAEVTIAAAIAQPGRALAMNQVLNKLPAFNWIRPRSGTAASPAAQAAETVLTFITKA